MLLLYNTNARFFIKNSAPEDQGTTFLPNSGKCQPHNILNKNHCGNLTPFMPWCDTLRWHHVAGNSAYCTHTVRSQTILSSVKVLPFIKWGWLLRWFKEWDCPSIIYCTACSQNVFIIYCNQPYMFFCYIIITSTKFCKQVGSKLWHFILFYESQQTTTMRHSHILETQPYS
jgi:hypothetical protein